MLRVSARRKARISPSLGEKVPTSPTRSIASSIFRTAVFVVVVVVFVVVAKGEGGVAAVVAVVAICPSEIMHVFLAFPFVNF
jgi:hypothetical protein